MASVIENYPRSNGTFDEFVAADGVPRHATLADALSQVSLVELTDRQRFSERQLREKGITFAVYGHEEGTEKVWPFDIVPRVDFADGMEHRRTTG